MLLPGPFGSLPSSATFSIGTFNSCAIKPMTEKMTNPANILVALFVHVTMIVSLQWKGKQEEKGETWSEQIYLLWIQEFLSI